MGDRANVKVVGMGDVYLYTHWMGNSLPAVVKQALITGKKVNRLDDASYLTRIIFCEMIKDEPKNSSTGFGISGECGDGADRIVTVNVEKQTVSISTREEEISIDDYIKDAKTPEW